MVLKIKTVVKHNIRLIAVASQLLGHRNIYDIEQLEDDDGNIFEIQDNFTYNISQENAPFPSGLFLLATGQNLDKELIQAAYKLSDYIYFFIVIQK